MWYQLNAENRVIGLRYEEPPIQDTNLWTYTTLEFPENFEDYVLIGDEFVKQPIESTSQPASASDVISALVQNSPQTVLPLLPDDVVSRMYNFFPDWVETEYYAKDSIVSYDDVLYKCIVSHNSTPKTVPTISKYWEKVVKEV